MHRAGAAQHTMVQIRMDFCASLRYIRISLMIKTGIPKMHPSNIPQAR
jgi:hypothetical protein